MVWTKLLGFDSLAIVSYYEILFLILLQP
jgi:hypothetical protein